MQSLSDKANNFLQAVARVLAVAERSGSSWHADAILHAVYDGQRSTLDGGPHQVNLVVSPRHKPEAWVKSQPLAYVAGPYRSKKGLFDQQCNIALAAVVAQQLWLRGFAVVCPHTNTANFDGVITSEDFIRGDLTIISRCDLVVLIPNWEHSEGAQVEAAYARDHQIPTFIWPRDRARLESLIGYRPTTAEAARQSA